MKWWCESPRCPYSKLSFHPGMPGRRLPMLTTAAGRAYFAFASKAAQDTILDILRSKPASGPDLANNPQFIGGLIQQTRSRGYATNFGEWEEEPKFGGYGVPIRNAAGEAIASLNAIFLTAALTQKDAQEKLLASLSETAHAIENAYAAGPAPPL
jgi:IclR family mhp operon transcriptional activator